MSDGSRDLDNLFGELLGDDDFVIDLGWLEEFEDSSTLPIGTGGPTPLVKLEPLPAKPQPAPDSERMGALGLMGTVAPPCVALEPKGEVRQPVGFISPRRSSGLAPPPDHEVEQSGRILRFTRSERLLHWSIAGPFLVCFLSALALWLGYTDKRTPLRELLGWIHRIAGSLMIVLPALVAALHWKDYRVHLQNIKEAWVWTARDIRWLFLMGPATINKTILLPEQDKFNAAEKINFINVMVSCPLYIITGLAIWQSGVAFWPWTLHVLLAISATPLLLGHLFMAICNPDTRAGLSGMFSGYVDRRWAKHHYRDWYRRTFEQTENSTD